MYARPAIPLALAVGEFDRDAEEKALEFPGISQGAAARVFRQLLPGAERIDQERELERLAKLECHAGLCDAIL